MILINQSRRRKTEGLWPLFYCCFVNHKSGLQRNTFSKLSHIFFDISKFAANYDISMMVSLVKRFWSYECRKNQPFRPGWAANIRRMRSWTFCLPCPPPYIKLYGFQPILSDPKKYILKLKFTSFSIALPKKKGTTFIWVFVIPLRYITLVYTYLGNSNNRKNCQ